MVYAGYRAEPAHIQSEAHRKTAFVLSAAALMREERAVVQQALGGVQMLLPLVSHGRFDRNANRFGGMVCAHLGQHIGAVDLYRSWAD